VRAVLIHVARQTDMMKVIDAFRDCTTAPKKKSPRTTFLTTTVLKAVFFLVVRVMEAGAVSVDPATQQVHCSHVFRFSVEVAMQPKLRGTGSSQINDTSAKATCTHTHTHDFRPVTFLG